MRRWLQDRRQQHAPTTPHLYRAALLAARTSPTSPAVSSPRSPLPSPRQLAWLLIRRPDEIPAPDAWIIGYLVQDPEARTVATLVERFASLVGHRGAGCRAALHAYAGWLEEARTCGIAAVVTCARGVAQDGAAVRAALTTPWSNGQTEGHITKLKMLKRQMYGRANLDLLQRRLLLAA